MSRIKYKPQPPQTAQYAGADWRVYRRYLIDGDKISGVCADSVIAANDLGATTVSEKLLAVHEQVLNDFRTGVRDEGVKASYDLGGEVVRDQLLNDFRKVKREDDLHGWLENYGLPFNEDSGRVSSILNAARSIRWLYKLSGYAINNDLPRLKKCLVILDAAEGAQYKRTSSKFNAMRERARIVKEFPLLDTDVRDLLSGKTEITKTDVKAAQNSVGYRGCILQSFSSSGSGAELIVTDPTLGAHGIVFQWDKGVWDEVVRDDMYHIAAKEYVLIALGIILTSVSPTYTINYDNDDYVVQPALRTNTPWQAMNLALFELIGRGLVKICPICHEPFTGRSSKKRFCTDACRNANYYHKSKK